MFGSHRNKGRRLPAAVCLGALAMAVPFPFRGPEPPAAAGARLPLVLVPGEGTAAAGFGLPEGGERAGAFYAALRRRGYAPGKTLWWMDREAGEGFQEAARRLAPLVDQALRATGAPAVDIVARGSGALAARYYIHALGGRGRVRTLVMINPPNRGSALVTAYKAAGIAAEVAARRRAVRRGLGRAVVLGAPRIPFSGETDYVDRVAYEYFEPRYEQFLNEGVFLRRPGDRARAESFAAWLARRHPAEFAAAFPGAQRPPLLEEPGGKGAPGVPEAGPGAALTRSFYNLLALQTARTNYRLLAPWTRVAMAGWRDDVKGGGDGIGALESFVRGRVRRLWEGWRDRLAAAAGSELWLAGGRAVWGFAPSSPAAAGLVSETVSVGAGEPRDLLANFALADLNGREAARRDLAPAARDAVRYVTVVAAPPRGPGALGVPGVAAELARQADGAFLPSAPLDAYVTAGGLRALLGGDLLARGDVVRRVLEHLDAAGPVRRWEKPDPSEGQGGAVAGEGRAGLAEPVVVGLDVARLGAGGALTARVRPLAAPGGLRFAAFLAAARGGRLIAWRPLAPSRGDPGWLEGRLDLEGLDPARDRAYLVARLLPRRGAPTAAMLAEAPLVAFTYQVASCPGGACPGGAGAQGGRPAAAARAAGATEAKAAGATEPRGPGAGGAARERSARQGVPRIHVVYRNKRTTGRVEDRTYHRRWEWDFGDGTTWRDDDPSHTTGTVEHAFAPGRYTVRARSRSNKGTVLREITWDVEVGSAGPSGGGAATRLFRAETVREPVPLLVIHGPEKWIVGRPAQFRLEVRVPRVPYLQSVSVVYHPARVFEVQWKRPGRFRVVGAAVVRIVYRLPEGPLVLVNTYVREKEVEVLATSITG